MKLYFIIFTCFFLVACNNTETKEAATSLDAGREFIRASLDGNFDKAETLLLKDSQNVQMFSRYKTYFKALPADKKVNYKNASYEINKYEDVGDSATIINYSNSFMNKPMEIKVIRDAGQWKVDFKYTSSGNLPIN